MDIQLTPKRMTGSKRKRTKMPKGHARRRLNFPSESGVQKVTRRGQVQRGFVGAIADAKFLDTPQASYEASTTGSITHLDVVTQGTTVNSREGKAFRLRSLQIRGNVVAKTTTTICEAVGYVIWDRQPNKALPAITDILDSNNGFSFAKRENKQRFLILKKFMKVVIGNSTTPTVGREMSIIEKWLKLPEECIAQCTALDTTGAIGNRINGALYFISTSSNVTGTGAANFNLGFRVNFSDI